MYERRYGLGKVGAIPVADGCRIQQSAAGRAYRGTLVTGDLLHMKSQGTFFI